MSFLRMADIDEHWDRIRPGLESALRKGGEELEPEEVRDIVRRGDVKFCISDDFGAIWHVKVNEFTGVKTLWIWLAWSEGGGGALDKYQEQFTAVAKGLGLDRIAFASKRSGYARALDDSWDVALVEYERRIQY